VANRLPRDVYDRGTDPDPRFSMANERTFLAWIRTALALTAGAIAVQARALDLPGWARVTLSCVLLALAALAVVQAYSRWRRHEVAMRTGGELPGFAGGVAFAAGIVVLILGALVAGLLNR